MSAREDILHGLYEHTRGADLPPAWISRRAFSDPAGRFESSITAAKGEVRRASQWTEALAVLGEVLREVRAEAVVANDEPGPGSISAQERWPDLQWHVVGQTSEDLRRLCAAADVGISGADAALAETGSLVISSGPGRSRLVTLLPRVHVALVPENCLFQDIFAWTASRSGKMPANTTLVGGPSKTADIEFTMTVGVHGPEKLIVILYAGDEPK